MLVVLLAGFRHIPRLDPDQLFFLDKLTHSQKHDVLLLGDSRIYVGLNPSAFESALPGKSCYNYGFSALGFSDDYFIQADLLLKKPARGSTIVLGIDATSLIEHSVRYNAFEDVRELSSLESMQLRLFQHIWMGRDPIRRQHEFRSNGWVPVQPVPFEPTEDLKLYQTAYQNQMCSEVILQTICKWIQKWHAENVTVLALRMPTTNSVFRVECERLGYHPEHVKSELEKAGAVWLDLPNTDTESYDGSHLGALAAERISKVVANQLAKAVAQ